MKTLQSFSNKAFYIKVNFSKHFSNEKSLVLHSTQKAGTSFLNNVPASIDYHYFLD
ncbi:hypothetical protein FD08_GL003305 [Lentilactobacillus parakefiri DSM 10551]|nr:hypothetical protein FD08_GL003305 [Lentilactobacillus parakefiri DSM 10551]